VLDFASLTHQDEPVDAPSPARRSVVGFAIALAGAAIFVVSSFLPFFRIQVAGVSVGTDSSFFTQMTQGFGGVDRAGGLVFLFAGVLVVGVVAVVGIAGGSRWPWTPMALLCAAAAWSLTWIGLLAQEGSIQYAKEVGYWGMLAGTAIALVGGIVAAASGRRGPSTVTVEGEGPRVEQA
jgi:hypothetical protein